MTRMTMATVSTVVFVIAGPLPPRLPRWLNPSLTLVLVFAGEVSIREFAVASGLPFPSERWAYKWVFRYFATPSASGNGLRMTLEGLRACLKALELTTTATADDTGSDGMSFREFVEFMTN